jgi:hypothetical protein
LKRQGATLKCLRTVCSPNRNRLTVGAVFAATDSSWKPLTSYWNGERIAPLLEGFANRDRQTNLIIVELNR